MDPLLRKPCIGLLLIFLVAHLEKIIFYISVSTIIFIVKMLLISVDSKIIATTNTNSYCNPTLCWRSA